MDSPYDAQMTIHFACWPLPVLGYDDLHFELGTFIYGGGVGGDFIVDTSVCCYNTSQWLVHRDIHGSMTTCSCGGAYVLTYHLF